MKSDKPVDDQKVQKRKREGTTPQVKRKKTFHGPTQPKNALMQLNELKPGLKYIVESLEGDSRNLCHVVSVEVNKQKFIGKGKSKQLAKQAAAQAALASFVQFKDTPKAMQVLNRPVTCVDFTTDVVDDESIFSKFESEEPDVQHTSNIEETMIIPQEGIPLDCVKIKFSKAFSEAEKKNPVMLLHELHPGVQFMVVRETPSNPAKRFTMGLSLENKTFEGSGPNKKQAKAAVAKVALSSLYGIDYALPLTLLTRKGQQNQFR
ncbi:double-stranded RNA-specific editase 1-like [Limulus polyphemus]|uniref:Double-stranded RNA-specific editase 1-like n=1 Tax=Limulus polyphemus TaxID=6850 RepID=A0ABM1C3J7_LIMPO|nr:double-stranded RNA-specific editase 1-like [Limulus polyphemus]